MHEKRILFQRLVAIFNIGKKTYMMENKNPSNTKTSSEYPESMYVSVCINDSSSNLYVSKKKSRMMM